MDEEQWREPDVEEVMCEECGGKGTLPTQETRGELEIDQVYDSCACCDGSGRLLVKQGWAVCCADR